METVWIVGYRNDYWSDNDIYVYRNKEDAMAHFKDVIKVNKNENKFSYEEGNTEATWEYKAYFCSVSIWEQIVR
jgi:hypothetical protein